MSRGARVAALALGLYGLSAHAAQTPEVPRPAPLVVEASAIERFDVATPVGARFGKLVFLGGLQLRSADRDFGGLSGLRLGPDGRSFTAISDRGSWFRGELVYDGSRPVGLKDVTRSATPGRDGRPLPGRRGFDTEGLEIDGATAWVSAERVHWLTRYALDAEGRPAGAGTAVALPREAESAPGSYGYEAIARLGSGQIAMISEDFRDKKGDNRGFLVGGKSPVFFSVKRDGEFMPTDMVRLPDGRLALLERRFKPIFALAARIRLLSPQDIAPGATIDGPVAMEASLAQTIDNFEAIAVHRGPAGETVLTLVSDDNFNSFQRTLLMQFALER